MYNTSILYLFHIFRTDDPFYVTRIINEVQFSCNRLLKIRRIIVFVINKCCKMKKLQNANLIKYDNNIKILYTLWIHDISKYLITVNIWINIDDIFFDLIFQKTMSVFITLTITIAILLLFIHYIQCLVIWFKWGTFV